MVQNGLEFSRMVQNDPKLSRMVQNAPEWSRMIENGQGPEWSRIVQNRPHQIALLRGKSGSEHISDDAAFWSSNLLMLPHRRGHLQHTYPTVQGENSEGATPLLRYLSA